MMRRRAGIEADHCGMVRFEDAGEQGFQMVVCALLRYCEQAPAVISRNQAYAAGIISLERSRLATEVLDGIPQFLPACPVGPAVSKPSD